MREASNAAAKTERKAEVCLRRTVKEDLGCRYSRENCRKNGQAETQWLEHFVFHGLCTVFSTAETYGTDARELVSTFLFA